LEGGPVRTLAQTPRQALADLDAYGVAFVSLRDNLDLSTPSGRLMFQIIGAMAEFERSLIQERVRAGLRNAKLKGKTLGRPRRIVSADEMTRLREQGASLREIAKVAEVIRTRKARKHYVRELHLADPNDSVKQKLIEMFVPALNAQSKIFRYRDIKELASI
jgi:DNA invertase Pin-like site-specific DNA recombinase